MASVKMEEVGFQEWEMGYVTGQSNLVGEMEHRRRDALAGL